MKRSNFMYFQACFYSKTKHVLLKSSDCCETVRHCNRASSPLFFFSGIDLAQTVAGEKVSGLFKWVVWRHRAHVECWVRAVVTGCRVRLRKDFSSGHRLLNLFQSESGSSWVLPSANLNPSNQFFSSSSDGLSELHCPLSVMSGL